MEERRRGNPFTKEMREKGLESRRNHPCRRCGVKGHFIKDCSADQPSGKPYGLNGRRPVNEDYDVVEDILRTQADAYEWAARTRGKMNNH
jgi:hypothetical protein